MRILLLFLLFLSSSQLVLAHETGEEEFISANGIYLSHYAIQSASVSDFILPHYIAGEKILISNPITFKADMTKLPIPSEGITNESVSWDFGDGAKLQGIEVTHEYSSIGSYIITFRVESIDSPAFSEKILLHALPNASYQLPKAVITVNGEKRKDKNTIIHASFSDVIAFSGESSSGSSDIVSFYWDLGDGTTSNEKTLSHSYATYHAAARPILRVRDKNGFIADATVSFENTLSGDPEKKPVVDSTVIILLVLFLASAFIAFIIIRKRIGPSGKVTKKNSS